ncbi:hypothetical protein [Streptomyces sp. 8L]|uniref:hypothetical protein n=1 Tax=Streptomyces sp. 8L TaxID=2877242 RepID=UPI001CD671B3|nr:hypothetical protein [Streptomyces sp. 8L]MCA1218807.1 hypothetical protein [Streptomyces sp. 8L]
MSNPYDDRSPYGQSPYVTAPITPDRPRMFNSTTAHILWVLLPIITISLGAAIPFVVAAVKGVVRPWVAVAYGAVEIGIYITSTAMPDPQAGGDFIGLLLILLVVVSATHTGLLDSNKIRIGK